MSTTGTQTLPKTGTYVIDPAHTEVGFIARHLSAPRSGVVSPRSVAPSRWPRTPRTRPSRLLSRRRASTPTSSQRDDHLRTNDFLDVPNYPTLSLKSTGLKRVDDTHWVLTGDLTIRGVTKSVDFDLEFLGEGASMQEGKTVVAFEATATIDRRDFGVSFNHSLLDGSVVVGNKVVIEIEAEASLAD